MIHSEFTRFIDADEWVQLPGFRCRNGCFWTLFHSYRCCGRGLLSETLLIRPGYFQGFSRIARTEMKCLRASQDLLGYSRYLISPISHFFMAILGAFSLFSLLPFGWVFSFSILITITTIIIIIIVICTIFKYCCWVSIALSIAASVKLWRSFEVTPSSLSLLNSISMRLERDNHWPRWKRMPFDSVLNLPSISPRMFHSNWFVINKTNPLSVAAHQPINHGNYRFPIEFLAVIALELCWTGQHPQSRVSSAGRHLLLLLFLLTMKIGTAKAHSNE